MFGKQELERVIIKSSNLICKIMKSSDRFSSEKRNDKRKSANRE